MTDSWLYGDDSGQPEAIVNPVRAYSNTVQLADWKVAFEPGQEFTHQAVASLRDTIATSAQADDSLFTSDAAWSRYGYSWHRGAGAAYHDFGNDQDAARFRYATGIDVWTPGELRLLPQLHPYVNQSYGILDIAVSDSTWFVVADDGNFYLTYTSTVAGNTMASSAVLFTGTPDTAQCVAIQGDVLVCGTGTGIWMTDLVSNGSHPSLSHWVATGNWQKLTFVADRLLGVDDGVLKEISSSGTVTTVYEPFGAVGFTWTVIFSLGSRIYAGGHDGMRSRLWSFEVDSTGALVRSNEVADFALGELLFAADTTVGVVVFATNRGVRLGRPAGDGTLEYGPLVGVIDEQDGVNEYVAITCSGRWAFGMKYADGCTEGRDALVRFDLATFTSPLAPAWSYDVMPPPGFNFPRVGQTYDVSTGSVVYTHGLKLISIDPPSVLIGYQTVEPGTIKVAGDGSASQFWAIYGIDAASDVVRVGSNFTFSRTKKIEPYGQLVTASIMFGTVETKRVHWTQLICDQLNENQWIGIQLHDETQSHLLSLEVPYQDSQPILGVTTDTFDVTCEEIYATIILRGPETSSPTVRRWKLRAMPVVPPVEEWVLPLLIADQTNIGGGQGQVLGLNVNEFIAWVYSMWRSKAAFTMQIGNRGNRVRLDQFQWKDTAFGPNGDVQRGKLLVRLVSV